MDISSLQDLIAKFNGNFNLQANKKDPAADDSVPAASIPATPPSGKDLSSGDKVTLSAEALAYQKAHTLASGKFMNPNVFDDFMSALDPTNDQGDGQSGDDGLSSLLDALHAKTKGTAASQNSASDPSKFLDTLNGFLG